MSEFSKLVFDYLQTLVPNWRLCDEAWPVGDEHLIGIGVERNYGGQVLVVTLSDGDSSPHPSWPNIDDQLKAHGKAANRVVVVLDDRNNDAYVRGQTPFVEIPWSGRERLTDYITKDEP
jgi:hypothetical protein